MPLKVILPVVPVLSERILVPFELPLIVPPKEISALFVLSVISVLRVSGPL